MSYNYYCYGLVKKDGKWEKFIEEPLSDNLKAFIDFDSVGPEYGFNLIQEASYEQDGFVPETWEITLNDFDNYLNNKVQLHSATINGIIASLGLHGNVDFDDFGLTEDTIIGLNDGHFSDSVCPIAKQAIFNLLEHIHELNKCNYLKSLARTFDSMTYKFDDCLKVNRKFLIERK